MNARYFNAQFALGAHRLSQLPADSQIEVAFAGRSNAGKSSALNAITRNKKLARTSKTPGRTQEINCFSLGEARYVVDLPGYGYAKVPKKQQLHWQNTLTKYVLERKQLVCLAIVMDIRHPLTDLDLSMIEAAASRQCGLHILLTKADKLSNNAAKQTLMKVAKSLEQSGIEASLQIFSALKGNGVADAHQLLDEYFFPSDE